LPEGCCSAVDVSGRVPPAPVRYWDVRYRSEQIDLEEATEQLDTLLKRTVDMQLMSDVPLGVQLSGGVDSSLVVALMDSLRREKGDAARVKTFSVGFDVAEFSELGYARKVAERYGTEHHEITVGFKDFAEELPFLAWIYDEPMGEPAGIPTYFMCREAKKHVSVMLCGEGADEQFGGYSKYLFDQFSAGLDWLRAGLRNGLLRGVASRLPQHLKVSGLRSKIVLKRLAERYIPQETIYRRKVGFTVPLTRWFAGPWRGLIKDVLLTDRCLDRGYYNADVVRGIVSDHLQGRVDREQGIWLMLALEIWHRLFVDDDGTESAVARVKADFARTPRTLAVPA